MWKLYPNPPKAESWALHPRDVVLSLAAAMSMPGRRSPPPVPSAEDSRQQSPATAPAPAGTAPPGQGRGLSQASGPRSEPESEAVPGARGSTGFQPHTSFGRPAKGPCRFRLLTGDSAGGRAWAKLCPDPPPSDRPRVQLSQSRAGVTGSTSSLPAVPFLALSVSETRQCAGDGDTSAWIWPLPTATGMEPTGKETADKQAP